MRRVRGQVISPDSPDDPRLWDRLLDEANVPERYRSASVEKIRHAETLGWVRLALETEADWLASGAGWYLSGALNSGKSSIASILLQDAMRRCEVTLWLSVRDVPRVVFREGDDGARLAKRLSSADLIVLDDLGSEGFGLTRQGLNNAAGAALETVARIIYDRTRTLIITSNMAWGAGESVDGSDFGCYYGDLKGFVSVVRRTTSPVIIRNDQWPSTPGGR